MSAIFYPYESTTLMMQKVIGNNPVFVLHCICEGLRHVSEMAGDGSMDQNDLVGHCKFSDRLLRVLEKRKQCDAENIMVRYRRKNP